MATFTKAQLHFLKLARDNGGLIWTGTEQGWCPMVGEADEAVGNLTFAHMRTADALVAKLALRRSAKADGTYPTYLPVR